MPNTYSVSQSGYKKSFLSRFVEDPLMLINSAIPDETFCKLTVLIVNRIDAFFLKVKVGSHMLWGAPLFSSDI